MNREFITVTFIEKLSIIILTLAVLLYAASWVVRIWVSLLGLLYVVAMTCL
jgi:hypothetical protein